MTAPVNRCYSGQHKTTEEYLEKRSLVSNVLKIARSGSGERQSRELSLQVRHSSTRQIYPIYHKSWAVFRGPRDVTPHSKLWHPVPPMHCQVVVMCNVCVCLYSGLLTADIEFNSVLMTRFVIST